MAIRPPIRPPRQWPQHVKSGLLNAVEHVLLAYWLMRNVGDVSHNYVALEGTE